MLASPWPAPFDDDEWVFELKWDGVRCILTSDDGISLRSRAGNDMTGRYPELCDAPLPDGLVLDGEIVALNDDGRPSFELLQSRMNVTPRLGSAPVVPVTYVVFDLLYRGRPMLEMQLEDRYGELAEFHLSTPFVLGDRYTGHSTAVWDFVLENDLEGIVAKRIGSRYQPGVRSPDWRKVSNFKTLRAVVGGYTAGTGGRSSSFGALLLGLVDGDRLRWIGAVGSGFDERSLNAIREAADQMRVPESPFHPEAQLPAGAVWVEPRLVAVVRYKEWTGAARVRAPSFQGFTDDPVEGITWEAEGPSI